MTIYSPTIKYIRISKELYLVPSQENKWQSFCSCLNVYDFSLAADVKFQTLAHTHPVNMISFQRQESVTLVLFTADKENICHIDIHFVNLKHKIITYIPDTTIFV